MRCNVCGGPTKVTDNSLFRGTLSQRTRGCQAGHITKTVEVPVDEALPRYLSDIVDGMAAREATYHRRKTIAGRPLASTAYLAELLSISELKVKQLRKEIDDAGAVSAQSAEGKGRGLRRGGAGRGMVESTTRAGCAVSTAAAAEVSVGRDEGHGGGSSPRAAEGAQAHAGSWL